MDNEVVIQNFIDGKFQDPVGGNWIPNYEPATGKVYGKLPDSREGISPLGCSRQFFIFLRGCKSGCCGSEEGFSKMGCSSKRTESWVLKQTRKLN